MNLLIVCTSVWMLVLVILRQQYLNARSQWAPVKEPFVSWVLAAVEADRSVLSADEVEEAVAVLLVNAAPPRRRMVSV